MRLFLLPVSTRRTLIYCDKVQAQIKNSTKPSIHDRIVNKANATWAEWENSDNKYKKRLTDYGNLMFNRIAFEEWGLKTMPSTTDNLGPTEVLFPGRFLDKERVPGILRALATERQALHKQRIWYSILGLPLTIPFGLLPIIPNIPGFYLAFRAYSHWKAFYGSKYLEALLDSKEPLVKLAPSKTLDELYTAGLIHPSREHTRQATPTEEASQAVADLISLQSNNDTEDVMLLKRWNGKLLAEKFGLPGMELEIERAVEQVEKSLKTDFQVAEGNKPIEEAPSSEKK